MRNVGGKSAVAVVSITRVTLARIAGTLALEDLTVLLGNLTGRVQTAARDELD